MSTKISSAQVADLLKEGADVLRKTSAERDFYKEKCARMELRTRCEKIAQTMHEKGLELDQSIDDIADRHEKAASDNALNLAVIEKALELSGPDMATKIGQLTSDDPRPAGSGSQLEQYLNSFVGSVG